MERIKMNFIVKNKFIIPLLKFDCTDVAHGGLNAWH